MYMMNLKTLEEIVAYFERLRTLREENRFEVASEQSATEIKLS
jgi:hypothetical protein